MHDPVENARRLARLLDAADHAGAAQLLAPECVYNFGGSQISGRGAIIASYEAAHQDAVRTFDTVAYDSSVRADSDDDATAVIRYGDILTARGVTHRHECEQRVTIDRPSGMVVRIEHVNLPGERDKLNAFLVSVGLSARPRLEEL